MCLRLGQEAWDWSKLKVKIKERVLYVCVHEREAQAIMENTCRIEQPRGG